MTTTARRNRLEGRPVRNRLLGFLPQEDFERISPRLEHIDIRPKQVLYDVDQPITHVYFIEEGVASILGVMADGTAVETATVGDEGMVGLPLFHGTDRTSSQAFCQVAGAAFRLDAASFLDAVAQSKALTAALHRYSMALFALIGQGSACNRLHTMRERCARWLLLTHDRVGSDEFALTHQFLAMMLGVRRATVTEALQALQATGCLSYAQGGVAIHDRARLEDLSCECYRIVRREFDRLVGPPLAEGVVTRSPLDGVKTQEDGDSVLRDDFPSAEIPTSEGGG